MSDMNRKIAKYCPELDSPLGRFPLSASRWLDPRETYQGERCFIAASTDQGLKKNYVFGAGKYGRGYYHILTKDAYQNLKVRMSNSTPAGGCGCFASQDAKREMDEHDDVRRLMFARSCASRPDDGVARHAAISEARATAQAHHLGLQGQQLAHNTVNVISPM